MFQSVEELKKEIELFEDNMNRSNGSVSLLTKSLESLNANVSILNNISSEINTVSEGLEAYNDETRILISEKIEKLKVSMIDVSNKLNVLDELNESIEEKYTQGHNDMLSAFSNFSEKLFLISKNQKEMEERINANKTMIICGLILEVTAIIINILV